MTALELQERKERVLAVFRACDSEEAIASMEALARKLLKLEKPELKRPNCFTLEEVREMLKETTRDAKNKVGVSHEDLRHFFDQWR